MNLLKLQERARGGEKLAMLTCYDASFARRMVAAGVDILLIGDSLGNVIQGRDTTLPVTLQEMAYHTGCVARGAPDSFLIADMTFGTYQVSPEQAFANAALLMAAGAQMVKLEGGRVIQETMRFLTARGIPVCGHLGFTPQSVHQLGGFRIQGRSEAAIGELVDDARALEAAGAGMIVLELMPEEAARRVTEAVSVPTIGIGAGRFCSGQVLVTYDMLGLYNDRPPKFVHNFMQGAESIEAAFRAYVAAVKNGTYPAPEHCYV